MPNGAQLTFYPNRTIGFTSFEPTTDPSTRGTLSSGDTFRGFTTAIGGLTFGERIGTESGCLFSSSSSNTTIVTKPDPIDPPLPPVWPVLFSSDLVYGRDHLNANISMIRGDTYPFQMAIILDSLAVNLTGCLLEFTAKWRVTDTDNQAVIQLTSATSGGIIIDDPINGLATVTIGATNTLALPYHKVELLYDVRLTDTLGKIHTVLYGTLTVRPNITQT